MDITDESRKQERMAMIRKALQERAPRTYRQLEETGDLELFLEGRDEEMMQCFSEAKNKAWEETLTRFLDFFDPTYDETSSPM